MWTEPKVSRKAPAKMDVRWSPLMLASEFQYRLRVWRDLDQFGAFVFAKGNAAFAYLLSYA